MSDQHISVLLTDSVDKMVTDITGYYIDGTFGRGGHTRLLLDRLSSQAHVWAFDRDPEAIAYGKNNFSEQTSLQLVHQNFAQMKQYCDQHGLTGHIDGILLDLGVSSPQLDTAERGFSFMRSGPLDMRMNPSNDLPTAAMVLQSHSAETLAFIFREYGQEKHAWRIACQIKAYVETNQPLDTTTQLANLIEKTIGKREKKHPATRCFQALRIYINQELDQLTCLLNDSLSILKPKGRLSIISFHSLEDRLVKQFFTQQIKGPDQPIAQRHLPVQSEHIPTMRWIVKKQFASQSEMNHNIRARSAVLRIAEKI